MRWNCRTYCLLLPLLAACTQDFSAFRFDHAHTTPQDPPRTPDASDTPELDAGRDTAAAQPAERGESTPPPAHAGGSQSDPPPVSAAGHAAPQPDGPQEPAGQVDAVDAGHPEDAGSIDSGAPECAASWGELSLGMPSDPAASDASDPRRRGPPAAKCQACACQACASAILDCLHHRSPVERGLCGDVLSCALRERCQEYDCYCSSMDCGFPGGTGDGPCAVQINAAAGGNRSRVTALRNADRPDLREPLVRAAQAIACILGERPNSRRPTVVGNCDAACQ